LAPRLPDFLIVGAQKAGTTWLQSALRKHPRIFLPKEETPFFEDPDYAQSSLSQLEDRFSKTDSILTIGIKRPTYLSKPECAPRIARDIPHAKIITVLRSPVERAISAAHHLMRMGVIAVGDPDALLNDLMDRYARSPDPYGILHFGLYAGSVEQYAGLFGSSRHLIMLHSDIVDDPQAVFRTGCAFLGVDQTMPQHLPDIVNPGVYDRGKLASMNWMSRQRFQIDPRSGRLFERTHGFHRLTFGLAQRLVMALPNAGQKHARVTMATKQRLLDFYRADIERLSPLIGRDLSRWTELS